MTRDTGVEVSESATAVLEGERKRLLISSNERGGLDFDLVCALCRNKGGVLHFGDASGFPSVRPCPLCAPDGSGRESHG